MGFQEFFARFTNFKIFTRKKKTSNEPPLRKAESKPKVKSGKCSLINSIKQNSMYFVYAICLLLVGLGVYALTFTSYFKVDSVEYLGLENLEISHFGAIDSQIYGKSIFQVNIGSVENQVNQISTKIKAVKVDKFFPNRVVVQITEKQPVLVYVGFNASYLVGEKGEILERIINDSEINFEQRDYKIAAGLGDKNGDYVVDRFVANLSEEELESFDPEAIPEHRKQEILRVIESEIQATFNDRINRQKEMTGFLDQYGIPVIAAWDEFIEDSEKSLDLEVVEFVTRVLEELDILGQDFEIREGVLESSFRFKLITSENVTIIFSSRRDLKMQIEDLSVLLSSGIMEEEGISFVDLSSEKLLVY